MRLQGRLERWLRLRRLTRPQVGDWLCLKLLRLPLPLKSMHLPLDGAQRRSIRLGCELYSHLRLFKTQATQLERGG